MSKSTKKRLEKSLARYCASYYRRFDVIVSIFVYFLFLNGGWMIQGTFPLKADDETVANERTLPTWVESRLTINGAGSVRFLIVHRSATRCDRDYTVGHLLHDHKARSFNRCSIYICYEGGLDTDGKSADTRIMEQRGFLLEQLWRLHHLFPQTLIVSNCELPGVKKAGPCFDCEEYRKIYH